MKFIYKVFNLIKMLKVKGHFRKLKNGRTIWIAEHLDKREAAKKEMEKHVNKVVHADEKGTTIVRYDNKSKKHYFEHNPHDKSKELGQDDIHAEVLGAHNIDRTFIMRHLPHLLDEPGKTTKQIIDDLVKDAKDRGIDGTNEEIRKKVVDNLIEEIGDKLDKTVNGKTVITHAELSKTDLGRKMFESMLSSPNDEDRSTAKMALEHSDSAMDAMEKEKEDIKRAQNAKPEDCPVVANFDYGKFDLIDHQADALAQMSMMKRCIVDVDMGGGKGLMLPYDAANLLEQGKIKRPIIFVPGMTLAQNSAKITDEYFPDGRFNVFLLSTEVINAFGGDMEKLREHIEAAPANTIFMATHGVLGYSDTLSYKDSGVPEEERVSSKRAFDLSQCGFDYVAVDECFSPDTPLDTPKGSVRIADIQIGDLVKNCLGYKRVTGVSKRKQKVAVTVVFNGESVKCSENHPWLTPSGWVRAKDLREGDYLVKSDEAMRVVQKGLSSKTYNQGDESESFLWQVLLGEMENVTTENTRGGIHRADCKENISGNEREAAASFKRDDAEKQPNEKLENKGEDVGDSQENKAQTDSARREWERPNESGSYTYARIGRWLGLEFTHLNWKTLSGRTNMLQTGLSELDEEDLCRMRRPLSLFSKSARQKERRFLDCFRVESVEIHESASDERNPDGYYYDLEVEGHPSFSVNKVLVHNSHKVKNPKSLAFKGLMHFSKAKYKRLASGTFISNSPEDVLGQLSFMNPLLAQNSDDFKKEYGFEESKAGRKWKKEGIRRLREKLKENGYIDIRRSAWLDKLPERDEQLMPTNLTPAIAIANEWAISDSMDAIEELMKSDKKIVKEMAKLEAGEDEDLDSTEGSEDESESAGEIGQVILQLEGLTDYPHEFGLKMEAAKQKRDDLKPEIEKIKDEIAAGNAEIEAGGKKGVDPDGIVAWRKIIDHLHLTGKIAKEEVGPLKFIGYFKPKTLQACINLKGQTSPKAEDFYKMCREHLKDPKNGKAMLFCGRLASVKHVMDNAPADLKKHMIDYHAALKGNLLHFLEDTPDSPKILVACDESIAEGVNLQIANLLYRYDMKYSPGRVEQSYARIWRFGQKRAAKIRIGLCNNSMDITKWARCMNKLDANMQVVSDYDGDEALQYKLNINNIRNHRNLDEGLDAEKNVTKNILDYQKKESVVYKEKYKSGKFKSPGKIIDKEYHPEQGNMGSFHPAYHRTEDKEGRAIQQVIGNQDDAIRHGVEKHGGDVSSLDEDIVTDRMRPDVNDLHRFLGKTRIDSKEGKTKIAAFWKHWKMINEEDPDADYVAPIHHAVEYLQKNGVKDKPKKPIFGEGGIGADIEDRPKEIEAKHANLDMRLARQHLDDAMKANGVSDLSADIKDSIFEDANNLMTHLGDKYSPKKVEDFWSGRRKLNDRHKSMVEHIVQGQFKRLKAQQEPKGKKAKEGEGPAIPPDHTYLGEMNGTHYAQDNRTGRVMAGKGTHDKDYKHFMSKQKWNSSIFKRQLEEEQIKKLGGGKKKEAKGATPELNYKLLAHQVMKEHGLDHTKVDPEALGIVYKDVLKLQKHEGDPKSYWDKVEAKEGKSSPKHKKIVEETAKRLGWEPKASEKGDLKSIVHKHMLAHGKDPKDVDPDVLNDLYTDVKGFKKHGAEYWKIMKEKHDFKPSAIHKKVVESAAEEV